MYGVYVPCFRPVFGIPFKYRDIHDNLKDNQLSNSVQDSAQSSASGQLAALGLSTGNLNTSDNAVVQDSGNVSNTLSLIDPGTVAASADIAKAAIASNTAATDAAASTLQYALLQQTKLASTASQGQINALAKTFGWVAVAVAALYAAGKVLSLIFSGKKKEAAT